MTEENTSVTSITVEQTRKFCDYLIDKQSNISSRSYSPQYSKANRHEGDRVREMMSDFYLICTGIKSFNGFSCSAEIVAELSVGQVSAMLTYLETRKGELKSKREWLRANRDRYFDYEDLEQLTDQARLFQEAKVTLENIMRGADDG